MSKVLLVLPPSRFDLDSYKLSAKEIWRIAPVGVFNIATYLKSKGHEARVVDCRALIVNHKTVGFLPYLYSGIMEFSPDIIGINALTAIFNESVKIARSIKEKFAIPIILGGVHPSVEPALSLKQNPNIDAVCIGEGEDTLLELVGGNKNPNGLMWRDRMSDYMARLPEKNIDKYPYPDFTLGDSEYYTAFTRNTLFGGAYRGIGVLTSRSCVFSCKFCASDWSKPYRTHSVDYVVGMVKQLSSKYDIEVVGFYDDSLATDRKRLEEICRAFIKHQLFQPYKRLRWFSCMRANQVELDLLRLMKEAGCFSVSIGIESGSDDTLRMMNKKTTVEMNRKACEMVNESGLLLKTAFILGIPQETEMEMEKTISFIKWVKSDKKGVSIFRPLPGSSFYNEFIEKGVLIKTEIDWDNLGNFSVMPDKLFCDVSRERFEILFDKAQLACVNNVGAKVRGLVPLKIRQHLRRLVV